MTLAGRQIRRHSLAEPVDGQTGQNINEHRRGEPLEIYTFDRATPLKIVRVRPWLSLYGAVAVQALSMAAAGYGVLRSSPWSRS